VTLSIKFAPSLVLSSPSYKQRLNITLAKSIFDWRRLLLELNDNEDRLRSGEKSLGILLIFGCGFLFIFRGERKDWLDRLRCYYFFMNE
jgi:hypothetical protein